MQKMIVAALAAGACACCGLAPARAADFPVPQAAAPPPDYGPPPVDESYDYPPPPPPVAYGIVPPPPPDVYVYDAPVYGVAPGPFYGPYWRGFDHRFAYGYGPRGGRWGGGRGWHR